jgi:hypothetical protein
MGRMLDHLLLTTKEPYPPFCEVCGYTLCEENKTSSRPLANHHAVDELLFSPQFVFLSKWIHVYVVQFVSTECPSPKIHDLPVFTVHALIQRDTGGSQPLPLLLLSRRTTPT